jgi:hypothetical protein
VTLAARRGCSRRRSPPSLNPAVLDPTILKPFRGKVAVRMPLTFDARTSRCPLEDIIRAGQLLR